MTQIAYNSLVDAVAIRSSADADFSPEIVEALRLAEMYDAIQPEEFKLPRLESFDAYKAVEVSRLAVLQAA